MVRQEDRIDGLGNNSFSFITLDEEDSQHTILITSVFGSGNGGRNMMELTGWVLVISLSSITGRAITAIEGFTEGSCANAAIMVLNQYEDETKKNFGTRTTVKAFCIPRIGRRL